MTRGAAVGGRTPLSAFESAHQLVANAVHKQADAVTRWLALGVVAPDEKSPRRNWMRLLADSGSDA
jgi:hypothetical protein